MRANCRENAHNIFSFSKQSFFQITTSRQNGSFNRSLSYPSNLESHSSRISLSDHTSSPLPRFSPNSPRRDSDDSFQTVFNTISNFNNSDTETPGELLYSEPSPTYFSQLPFQPFASQLPGKTSHSPSSYNDASKILRPMSSNQPGAPSPMTDNQLEHEKDNFITQQQHLHDTNNAMIIHQLIHSASTTKSSTQSVHIAPIRAHRNF